MQFIYNIQRSEKNHSDSQKNKKKEVVPGIEPGLLVSETRVIAITLHNLLCWEGISYSTP